MKCLCAVSLLLLIPSLALAQDPVTDIDSLRVPGPVKAVMEAFEKPLHPIVGGVASGGGVGVGIGYDSPRDQRWFRDASATVTHRRYWSFEGETGLRRPSGAQAGVFGEVRHMGRLDFYGLGPNSRREDRAAFRLRETTIGTRGWFRPRPALRLGGSVAMYVPDLGPGTNPSVISLDGAFNEAGLPDFVTDQPTFGRYRGFAELVYPVIADPNAQEDPDVYRGTYQLAFEAVRDHELSKHSFHRWETEVQQRIPGFFAGQRLTLHGMVAMTQQDADVPFYLLYTLGGSSGLKSFRPDMIGTDGTRATLRSVKNFRFRDRDLLLMQAEYRIPLMDAVHATVFVDSGQVAPRPSGLFKDLQTGTGFSLSYMRKGRALGRVDVGYGGGEGMQLFWSFGAFQP